MALVVRIGQPVQPHDPMIWDDHALQHARFPRIGEAGTTQEIINLVQKSA